MMPSFIKDFDDEVTALLIETRAINNTQLDIQINQIEDLLKEFKCCKRYLFYKR